MNWTVSYFTMDLFSATSPTDGIASTVPSWKIKFCLDVLRPLMSLLYSSTSSYDDFLAFESRITSIVLPQCAQGDPPGGDDILATAYYFTSRLYVEEGKALHERVRLFDTHGTAKQ
jgi:hypothetical protein